MAVHRCRSRLGIVSALSLLVFSVPAQASVIRLVDLSVLVRRADIIVRGTTLATVSSLTEDGKQIHTVAKVRVQSALKGAPASEIEVRTPGGTIGDITQMVHGAPRLVEGQKVILFLHRVSERRFTIEGFAQGKYEVVNGHVVQDLRGIGILGPDGAIRPGTTTESVPERDFVARVRKALEGTVAP